MMFEIIPTEMRLPSVITVLLFAISAPLLWYLYRRIASLETVVVARCIDIEKLGVVADNLEKMILSNNDDNRQTIAWIREENATLGDRIENNIAGMRKEIHGGN